MFFQYWQILLFLPKMTLGGRTCPCCQMILVPRWRPGESFEAWLTMCQVAEAETQSTQALPPVSLQTLSRWQSGPSRPAGTVSGVTPSSGLIWPNRLRSVTPPELLRQRLLRKKPKDEIRPGLVGPRHHGERWGRPSHKDVAPVGCEVALRLFSQTREQDILQVWPHHRCVDLTWELVTNAHSRPSPRPPESHNVWFTLPPGDTAML